MKMNPFDFLKSVYLGDRACKSIFIDSWDSVVKIGINSISRIRSESGNWDYYTDEDVDDGFLVFEGVSYFSLSPEGLLPNDLVNEVLVRPRECGDLWEIEIGVDSANEKGEAIEVRIKMIASKVCIERKDGSRVDE